MANTNLLLIVVKHISTGIAISGKCYINLFISIIIVIIIIIIIIITIIIIIIIWSIGGGGLGICAFCYM